MKKNIYLVLSSLAFGSIPFLFWAHIQDYLIDIRVSNFFRTFVWIAQYYLLIILFMSVLTSITISIVFRYDQTKKKDVLNLLSKFIVSYLMVNVLYYVADYIFFTFFHEEYYSMSRMLDLGSHGYSILPTFSISFVSSANNLLIYYGIPFTLSILVALGFYLVFRLILSKAQWKTFVPRGFLIQLMFSSGIIGVLDALYHKLFGINNLIAFCLSIIYVLIIFLLGLLFKQNKQEFEEGETVSSK